MRLLTIAAAAALAAGLYHYRHQRLSRRARPAGSDELLAESVRSGIAGASPRPVQVRCINGVVSLRGTVRSNAERDLVLAAALAVAGVTQVTNFLEIEESAERLGDEPVGDLGPMQSGIATGV